MSPTRRQILALAGSSLAGRLLAATLPQATAAPTKFDVDRLLEACAGSQPKSSLRRYTASATVTFFSVPIVSRSGVGSGWTSIEEIGNTVSIRFGAGSHPESARGLNRLGFIQEAIAEEAPGKVSECAYFAFMTTSQEKNLSEARGALAASGTMLPYKAAQGYGARGRFASRVDRLLFPAHYTWRDITRLIGEARREMLSNQSPLAEVDRASVGDAPCTFLYAVRRALLDGATRTKAPFIFNGNAFTLDAAKENDAASAERFEAKKLIAPGRAVTRLNAAITALRSGEKTPFRLWYETGCEQIPPLRFEYQARSFLHLTFEADSEKENA